MKNLRITTVSGGAGTIIATEEAANEFVQALTHKNYVGRDHSADGVFCFTEKNSSVKGGYQVIVLAHVIDVAVSEAP